MSVWTRSPVVVGHRGGRGEGWPAENTLAAFARARREGAEAIELDVRTTRDGEVVVFHDEDLARMTEGRDRRRLCDVDSFELAEIRLAPSGDAIPTLADALRFARAHGVGVNVELKHDVPSRRRLARGAARCIREARADVLVSTFDPTLLALFAALSPRTPRALLTHDGERYGSALHALAMRAPRGLVRALHVERTETAPAAIAAWKRRGLKVGVWTVNDAREATDLVALGVDYVITDRPAEIVTRR